jgi:hypothetical protein
MNLFNQRILINAVSGLTLVLVAAAAIVGQSKSYRGSAGGSHFDMRLDFQGSNVSGTYAYDSVGEEIKVAGTLDSQKRLELTEFVKKKPTGKFHCKPAFDDPTDWECTWSRADGSREIFATLGEQHVDLTNGLQIVPKTISDRRIGLVVSYPQLTSSGKALPAGAAGFNQRILTLARKAIKDFEPGEDARRNSFDTNYRVLLATSDTISVEMTEYSDAGGAHPNSRYWSLTYDLAANKELPLESIFKPDSDYKMAIANYVVSDIDRRADAFEAESAKTENRQPKPRDESITSVDQLSEISDWGLTPQGVVVYLDFPHVMAVFDKNFIPYSAIKDYLKPNSPASQFNRP